MVNVPSCAGMLETGFHLDSLQRAQSFTTYESHVLFALRFMIDCSISGGSWVELKRGAYKLLAAGNAHLLEWKACLQMMLLLLNCLFINQKLKAASQTESLAQCQFLPPGTASGDCKCVC